MSASSLPDTAAACSDGSAAAGEALAGTASRANLWLLAEQRGAWGRDAVADTDLPQGIQSAMQAFQGKALLVRRPERRAQEMAVFHAETTEDGGTLRSVAVSADPPADAVTSAATGEIVSGALFLVCTHGRRDPCCARRGVPMYDALAAHVDPVLLWQSSHQGGHRFAANILVLPAGVQLGRTTPADASRIAALLAEGRIPLELYRGRTLYDPLVQAAEIEIRRARRLDRIADLRLLEAVDGHARFDAVGDIVTARVTTVAGPAVAASCGDEPAPTTRFVVELS